MRKNNVIDFDQSRETREKVLERLFRDHETALRAFLRVRLVVVASDENEDIIQDVFIRLARMDDLTKRLPAGKKSSRSFVIKVANNLILDLERKRKVRSQYLKNHGEELKDENMNTISPDIEVQSKRELEQAKKELMSMKPCWRDAFILHRFGNKSYKEIALDMDVSTKQIEKYIEKAVKHLRSVAVEIRGVKK